MYRFWGALGLISKNWLNYQIQENCERYKGGGGDLYWFSFLMASLNHYVRSCQSHFNLCQSHESGPLHLPKVTKLQGEGEKLCTRSGLDEWVIWGCSDIW